MFTFPPYNFHVVDKKNVAVCSLNRTKGNSRLEKQHYQNPHLDFLKVARSLLIEWNDRASKQGARSRFALYELDLKASLNPNYQSSGYETF